jgi:hypothetical protein
MQIKKLASVVLIAIAASFAQQSDSIQKQSAQQPAVIIVNVSKDDSKSLKKQLFVPKKNTTWTKIKDLFM